MNIKINSIKRQRTFFALSGIALAISASNAFATDGIYFTGNGAISSGMGGAAIALPQDVASAVDNPAGLAELGSRVDFYGTVVPLTADSTFGSASNHLFSSRVIVSPGFGLNYQIAPQWTFGVTITGAGAASNYGRPVLPVSGAGDAKASLIVVNTSPTITYKPLPSLSIGASLVFGVEQFRLSGLVAPGPDGALEPVPSHGNEYATGVGAGIGVLWTPTSMVSLGVSYFTKTWFTALPGYKDDALAPSGGHADSPSRYGVGVAMRPLPGLTIALDYLRIEWAGAAGYNTPTTWGYRDQNVGRVGISYDLNARWTLRAGYSFANNNVDSNHTVANMYGPGISPRAVTAGATYAIDKNNRITAAFEYDIPTTIVGTGPSLGTNIRATYQVYTAGYTHRF
ncbi:OmpP1/FadL family transporter [Paraburkholderia graminis]|uniref:OmpP1/FadL family transporter n=1 Tax=Paraburkholderia graminis TaxID=60548 RepID=UPI00279141AB|nr:outer membrane protein transport protein [Paraburkholderia graminis]MDQ0627226.1 long-chain fatty acid transport protein [Paraburkholderia graminis]